MIAPVCSCYCAPEFLGLYDILFSFLFQYDPKKNGKIPFSGVLDVNLYEIYLNSNYDAKLSKLKYSIPISYAIGGTDPGSTPHFFMKSTLDYVESQSNIIFNDIFKNHSDYILKKMLPNEDITRLDYFMYPVYINPHSALYNQTLYLLEESGCPSNFQIFFSFNSVLKIHRLRKFK